MLKYQEIAGKIEKSIKNQRLKQGDKLPSLEELVSQFNASKSTVRKALEILENKGAIYQLRGSGIFVRKLKRRGYIDLGLTRGLKGTIGEYEMTTEVLAVEVIDATSEIAKNLSIEIGDAVYYIKRVRFLHGQPLCIEESYFVKSIVTYMNKEIAADSIFNYLRTALKLNLGFSDSYFHVGKINEEESKFLKLSIGEPKFYLESIFYLATGKAFDYSKTTYHYDQAQFFIQATSE